MHVSFVQCACSSIKNNYYLTFYPINCSLIQMLHLLANQIMYMFYSCPNIYIKESTLSMSYIFATCKVAMYHVCYVQNVHTCSLSSRASSSMNPAKYILCVMVHVHYFQPTVHEVQVSKLQMVVME